MSEVRTEVSFPLDEASRKRALAALEEIRKAQAINARDAVADAKRYDELTKKNAELDAKYSKLVKTLKQADSSFRTQEEQLRDNAKAALDAAKAMEQLAQSEEKAAQEAEQLRLQQLDKAGQTSAAIGQVGGAVSQIPGLGALGGATGGGTAIFDVLENLPKLTENLKGLPQIIQATAQSSGGLVSTLATSLTPVLGASTASFAALALPIAAVAAPIAIIVKLMDEMAKNAEAAGQAEQRRIEIINSQIATENEFQRLSNQRDVGGILEARDTAQQALKDVSEQLTVASTSLDDLREQEAGLFAARNAAASGLNLVDLAHYNDLLGQVQAQIAAQVTNYDSLEQQFIDLQSTTALADTALAGFSEAEINAAQNAESLAQVQEDLNRTTQDYEQTLKSQEQILNQIRQLEHQANEVRANYAEQNLDRAADEALASKQALETQALDEQFANEDRIRANQEFQDSLLAIEQQGQDKIKSLRADLGSLAGERIKAISEAETKGNADISKLQKEFMSDSLKTVEKFQDSEKKIQQRGQIDRLRLLQDLNDSLADAQRDNNVIAFLEAQRNGEKQLQRESQDAGLEAKQRADDFARENEERRNALNQRIADIQANIDKEREQINLQFAERQAAIQKSIADEEAAIQERTRAAIEANNKQAENEARNAERELLRENLKAQQQEQRDALVEARRVREHQEQLARIDQQAQAQQRALQGVISQLGTLQAQAAAQRSNIGTVSGQGSFGAGIGQSYTIGSNSIRIGGNSLRAFAEGGVADKPTLGLLGERSGYGDLVLPYRKSDGLPVSPSGRMSGRGAINVTYSPVFQSTIGDIVSSSEVSEALRDFALQHGQAQIAALERMLNP